MANEKVVPIDGLVTPAHRPPPGFGFCKTSRRSRLGLDKRPKTSNEPGRLLAFRLGVTAGIVTALAPTATANAAVPTPQPPRPPDLRLFFTSVTESREPHPLWRVACWCGRGVDRFVAGLQTTLLVFYALLGLTAFPLFAQAHWIGGMAMVTVGSVFAWLLRLRWQSAAPSRSSAGDAEHWPRLRRFE